MPSTGPPPRPVPARQVLTRAADPAVDLILGGHCLGCGRAGRLVCPACLRGLDPQARLCWPTPVPPGLVAPWASTVYGALPRALVLGLKEHGLLSLVDPLARLLAVAVIGAVAECGSQQGRSPDRVTTVLVPVPSRPRVVRARGHDGVGAVTASAAGWLRAGGHDIECAALLRLRPGVADQAGLDAVARRRNLAGSMTCPSSGLRRLARRAERVRVIVCDDVITTGSTLREAQRALEAVGLPVLAAAAVAATPRRLRPARTPSSGDEIPDSRRNFR